MMHSYAERGLTLIELCIALTILSIITFTATSYSLNLIKSGRGQHAIQSAYQAFKLARSEAITSGTIVTVCPLDLSNRCGNSWDQDLFVFRDADNSRSLTNDETIIRRIQVPSVGALMPAPRSRRYFQFGPLGEAKGTLGNVTYCPKNPNDKHLIRQLIMNFAGRVRFAQDTDGDNVVNKSDGTPVSCD
ncbi:GspH/FimT family pseudopilin [Marinobacter sp.]